MFNCKGSDSYNQFVKILRQLKQHVRSYIGPTIQSIAYHTGIMQLSNRLNHNGAIVLMYHSVAEEGLAKYIDPRDHVPPDVFEKQIAFLAHKRRVVALDELIDMLRKGKTSEAGTMVITFDDGYLDNLTVAAPILDQYKLKATLFLPTGYIDRGETQWVDQVYAAFKFRTKSALTWRGNAKAIFNLNDPIQYQDAYQAVCMKMLSATSAQRRLWLDDLLGQLQPSESPPRLTMSWDDVKNLISTYKCFQIGAHTMEHTDMTSVSDDEAIHELNCCARRIEDAIGIQPRHFSFPYGRTSGRLRQFVAEAGFESACGGDGSGPIINLTTEPYTLPRIEAPALMRRFDLLTKTENTGIWRKLGR